MASASGVWFLSQVTLMDTAAETLELTPRGVEEEYQRGALGAVLEGGVGGEIEGGLGERGELRDGGGDPRVGSALGHARLRLE